MGILSWLFKGQGPLTGTTRKHFGQQWPVLPARDPQKIATFWSNVLGFRAETVTAEQTNLSYEDGIERVNGIQVPKQKFLIVLGPPSVSRPANILALPTSWFESALGVRYLEFYGDSELQRAFEKKIRDNQGKVWVSQADNECDGIGYLIEDPEGNKVELTFTCCGIDKAEDWGWTIEPAHESVENYREPV